MIRSLNYKGRGRPRKTDYIKTQEGHEQEVINADALSVSFKKLGEFYGKQDKNLASEKA